MSLEPLFQRAQLWRGGEIPSVVPGIPTGHEALDQHLPGGWPQAALTELLVPELGIGAMQLVLPALGALSQNHWIVFVAPPHPPYAPALAAAGVNLQHVLWVRAAQQGDALWALEQALRSGSCAAVLGWPRLRDSRGLRRLQLAAEAGRSWGILFRPDRDARQASPAALRLRLTPQADGVRVEILKRRGGGAGQGFPLALPLARMQ